MENNVRDEVRMADFNEKRRVLTSQPSGVPSSIGLGEKPAVRDLLVYYARHSTMHGIPSIVGSRLYRGRRMFWCVVVCMMATLLVTVIYWQMSDFFRYPTVTSVNVKYVTEKDFPAVTICELNVFNKLFIDKLDSDTQKKMAYLTEITGIFHMVGKKVLDKILKDLKDSIANRTMGKTDEQIIQELLDTTIAMIEKEGGGLRCAWGDFYWEDCNVGLTTRVTDMGVCFTIDTRKLVKNVTAVNTSTSAGNPVGNAIRGLSLVVTTATEDIPYRLYHYEGFKVVLHDHREDPLPRSRGFVIGSNKTVEVEIDKHVRIGLEPPFMAFGTGMCVNVDQTDFVNPLKRYSYYTREACETECFVDYVIHMCECRHFLHPGNETLCPLETLRTCFRQAEAKYYGGHTTKEGCQCPMPCTQNVFSSGVSYATFRTTAMFKAMASLPYGVTNLHLFFPDPVVTTIEQVPVYSLEGLLGSIGGQVGLFMGFSLVTVAEMCELIFLLCTRSRRLFGEDTRLSLNHPSFRHR